MPALTKQELKSRVACFLKHKKHLNAASAELGIDGPTLKSSLKRAHRLGMLKEAPKGEGPSGQKAKVITQTDADRLMAALDKHGWDTNRTADELGVAEATVRRKIRKLGVLKPAAKRTLEEDIDLVRAREESRSAKARLQDALREMAALKKRLSEIEWAANTSFKPAEWTLTPRKSAKSEHIPYLLVSDAQIGETVNPAETDHAHGYDVATFRRRYRRMIDRTIYLSFQHAGGAWTYPGIVYGRGGDTISGMIHDELRETDEVTPIQAVEIAVEEESAGIAKLLEAFGRVEVKDAGGGNHDRTTHKPQSKRANAHSYDRLVSYALRREFRSEPRVTFQTTESPDVYFPIYQTRILLTHGDKIGSRGGHGFVGPAATVMRGAQRVIMEQAALGRHIDRVDMGHFHTPMFLGWVLVNGAFPGYSEYAKQARLRPHIPQQTLLFHHHRHGVVDHRPLYLED